MSASIGICCVRGVGPTAGGRTRNEDNYLVSSDGSARFRAGDAERVDASAGPGILLAIADGMGGHADGAIASQAAVQAAAAFHATADASDPETALLGFATQAHARLHAHARAKGAVDMGTTLTLAWCVAGRLSWVHVGDSRLYLMRDGEVRQLTHDHTRGEFARRDGRPLPPHPGALAQSFIFGSRGLGDDAEIRVDASTDTGTQPLLPGDRLLLCSDGLHGSIEPPILRAGLRGGRHPDQSARWLVDQAMAAGSKDNITAVVFWHGAET